MIKTRLQEIKPYLLKVPSWFWKVLGLEPSSPGSKASPLNPSLYCLPVSKNVLECSTLDSQGKAFCITSANLPTAAACPNLLSKQEKWEKPTKT